jgi:hypothetical protein
MKTVRWMIAGAVLAALVGCGAEEIASPGSGGNITINPPPVTETPTDPTYNVTDPAVALGGCPGINDPAGLTDAGTIKGPTGEYRVCTLPARITRSSTLERVPGVLYALNGRTDVGYDCGPTPGVVPECKLVSTATTDTAAVTLTINPGVIVFAKTGTSWLAVNRGNKLNAVGTAVLPIVFTSQDNVLGLATNTSQGKWGGVVLLGRAPITDCNVGGPPPSSTCWRDTEGSTTPAQFGGDTPADNSGSLDYVQIRYSGFILSANVELQALTLEGTGSGTVVRHLHSHNSSDDGFEIFGGRTSLRHIVVTGADDDTIDVDVGYKGTMQYVIGVQKTPAGDSMIELDSANANEDQTPRTNLKLANFTLVAKGSNSNNVSMLMRGKADATLLNGVLVSPVACLQFNGANILTTDAGTDKIGPPVFRSVVMSCGNNATSGTPFNGTNGVTAAEVQATFAAGANNSSAFTSTLTNTFINGTGEAGVAASTPALSAVDALFTDTNYIGAVRDATDTWYAGWTCNSSTANFVASPATRTLCTSLPSLQ